jgi:hypothetical protein
MWRFIFISFFYDLKNQYLKIENNTIQKNFLYGGWNKKIKFEDFMKLTRPIWIIF